MGINGLSMKKDPITRYAFTRCTSGNSHFFTGSIAKRHNDFQPKKAELLKTEIAEHGYSMTRDPLPLPGLTNPITDVAITMIRGKLIDTRPA